MAQASRRGEERKFAKEREAKEFDERVLDLARVTRVTKGGKRMRFRATVVVGDRKGRVGFGTAKGADVALSVGKAARVAKKRLITVPMVGGTIPHQVLEKFAAAKVLLKPAPAGTGIKAGGAMRVALELAGIPNVVGKQLGSANKINNVKAVMAAFGSLRRPVLVKEEKSEARNPKSETNPNDQNSKN